MDTNRKIAITAGILFFIGMVAGLLSTVPVIEKPEFLIQVSLNKTQVLFGAFFQFIMIPAYVGFALVLYPILRKYNEGLALGFVGFRIIAGVFHLIGVISLPLFLLLSQEYVNAGTPDSSYFQTIGGLLRAGRDLVNHVGMIVALSIGSIMCNYIFYKTKLVPRWLSGFGFIGAIFTMVASLLLLFGVIDLITPIYFLLNSPMAFQEITLAIWLISKGFNESILKKIAVPDPVPATR